MPTIASMWALSSISSVRCARSSISSAASTMRRRTSCPSRPPLRLISSAASRAQAMVEGPQMPAEPLVGTSKPTSNTRSRRRSNQESGTANGCIPSTCACAAQAASLPDLVRSARSKEFPATLSSRWPRRLVRHPSCASRPLSRALRKMRDRLFCVAGKRDSATANFEPGNRYPQRHMKEQPITNYLAYLLAQANRQMTAQLNARSAKRACRSSTGASWKC